eukprot:1460429-Prymnesium_polylepis.1
MPAAPRCATRFPLLWTSLRAPPQPRTISFVCRPEREPCGGVGDRLGGIVSVAAYSLVVNRTLLIDDPDLLRVWETPPGHAPPPRQMSSVGAAPFTCRVRFGRPAHCPWL